MYYKNEKTGMIYTGDMQPGDIPLTQQEEMEFIEKTQKEQVRAVRAEYFEKYVDFFQSKPLYWDELDDSEKQLIAEYRIYLKDYTKQESWYEQNPMTYEEWLVATHPVSEGGVDDGL